MKLFYRHFVLLSKMRRLLTGYMGTRNSSVKTRELATSLSEEIGCSHYNIDIEKIFSAFEDVAE
jgi:hypothetical protein